MNRLTPLAIISLIVFSIVGAWYFATSQASAQGVGEGINAQSQEPLTPSQTLFSYQGYLLDDTSMPINNPAVSMTFKLFSTSTGGSECWSESHSGGNAVNVEDGRFHVLLGQIIPIPGNCFTGDAYVEITVEGETLSPRELLTSVAFAIEANTLSAGANTLGDLQINGALDINQPDSGSNAGILNIHNDTNGNFWHIPLRSDDLDALYFTFYDSVASTFSNILQLRKGGNLEIVEGNLLIGDTLGAYIHLIDNENDNYWRANVTGQNTDNRLIFSFHDPTAGTSVNTLRLEKDGDVHVYQNLSIGGTCSASYSGGQIAAEDENCLAGSITSGAYIESNLMTHEERGNERIERFEQGDLLCWSAESNQLEKCSVENDTLIMGVADPYGKPIVLGAELIKVIGPVEEGDYLVASNIPGYAIATKNPTFGIVIAQALESFDGDQGLIMAMIRKM